MALSETQLLHLFGWYQQSLLAWLGVGLASLIGIVELLPNMTELKKYNIIFYESLVFLTYFSIIRIFELLKKIIDIKNTLQWDYPKTIGLISNIIDNLTQIIINNIYIFEVLLLIFIIFISNKLLSEYSDLNERIKKSLEKNDEKKGKNESFILNIAKKAFPILYYYTISEWFSRRNEDWIKNYTFTDAWIILHLLISMIVLIFAREFSIDIGLLIISTLFIEDMILHQINFILSKPEDILSKYRVMLIMPINYLSTIFWFAAAYIRINSNIDLIEAFSLSISYMTLNISKMNSHVLLTFSTIQTLIGLFMTSIFIAHILGITNTYRIMKK